MMLLLQEMRTGTKTRRASRRARFVLMEAGAVHGDIRGRVGGGERTGD